MLVNTIYDLQNINNNRAGTYALGRDIDASATASWNSGEGFAPIGTYSYYSTDFTGTFDGQGRTISNLVINRPASQNVGLFGSNEFSATARNLGLLNVSITGQMAVGGVVGQNMGTITGVYTSGSVIATNSGAGGIVGLNYGLLSNVHSSSAVSAPVIYAGGNRRDERRRHIAGLCDRARERRAICGRSGRPTWALRSPSPMRPAPSAARPMSAGWSATTAT